MKAIMNSIKPKWVAKILNGEKTIEVRRSEALYKAIQKLIGEYGYADIYVYCTKDEELFYSINTQKWYATKNRKNVKRLSNGVVKFKFRCYKVEEIKLYKPHNFILCYEYGTPTMNEDILLEKSCLTVSDLDDYLNRVNGLYQSDSATGYAIHINDLEIFDEPKELSEFMTRHYPQFAGMVRNKTHYELKPLTKAPQNFCYVEVE